MMKFSRALLKLRACRRSLIVFPPSLQGEPFFFPPRKISLLRFFSSRYFAVSSYFVLTHMVSPAGFEPSLLVTPSQLFFLVLFLKTLRHMSSKGVDT